MCEHVCVHVGASMCVYVCACVCVVYGCAHELACGDLVGRVYCE